MTKNIAVIRGDGIGPEIVNEALRVLDKIAELYGHTFHYTDVDMGGCAIDKWGDPLPQEMLDKCVASDSVLLGAVGGARKRVCCACARVWVFTATTARRRSGRSSLTLLR